ncbi:hypothetical protein D2E76_15940 [Mycobacteroides abscessus]|uniref:Uncharacterized protein n=1 Tax=Mycobacteroides abscessus TaxID=36809 RepID=A0ABD7HLU0_9MYCO|nr:hypothetical protein [Mycobacteroides abscessus]RIT36750.1 hypothetical protein D2E76_15940 [Mycobacteroides abscessus]
MSSFFTRFNRRPASTQDKPAAASQPAAPEAPPSAEPKASSGSWIRRGRDFVRRKLDERRQRREDKKKPPPQEPPPVYPPPPPPEPPTPTGDVSLRARLLFTVNTGSPGGRHYNDDEREAEHTLFVSMRFVEVLRDHVRAGRTREAIDMLTEPWYTQYLLEMVMPEIKKILRPHERAGARFLLTPNDVIEKPPTEG